MIKKLLSEGKQNHKLSKDASYRSFIMYMLPYNLFDAKHSICPNSTIGCQTSCLHTSGMLRFSNSMKSKYNKTKFYVTDKINFIKQLNSELEKLNKLATKNNAKFTIRLNGASDIDFIFLIEKFTKVNVNKKYTNLIFYDYTKSLPRLTRYLNKPYHLTFSRSESNWEDCEKVLKIGGSVAVVFKNTLPLEYKGFKVIDGDKSDFRFNDEKRVIVGLKAKGLAKKDITNFVV